MKMEEYSCRKWFMSDAVMDLLKGGRKSIRIYPKDGDIWISTGGGVRVKYDGTLLVSVDELADTFGHILYDLGVNYASGRDTSDSGWMFIVVGIFDIRDLMGVKT